MDESIINWSNIEKEKLNFGVGGIIYTCKGPLITSFGRKICVEGCVIKKIISETNFKRELDVCDYLKDYTFKYLLNVIFVDPKNKLIIFDKCMDTDLFNYIIPEKEEFIRSIDKAALKSASRGRKRFNKWLAELLPLFMQAAQGIKELHDIGFSHLDIKPENILYLEKTKYVCLCDYAFASSSSWIMKKQGTIDYMAPEIFRSGFYSSKKADMYSLGATFYVLSTGTFPHYRKEKVRNFDEIYISKMKPVDYPSSFLPLMKYLIESLMSIKSSLRPTIDETIEILEEISREIS